MKLKKTPLSKAFAAIIGTTAAVTPLTSTAIIPDGHYRMVVNDTPYTTGSGFSFGSDGNWNSSFTFGCLPGTKGCGSQGMYDDGRDHPSGGAGSGIAGDGVSGVIDITVSGSSYSLNTYNKDVTRFTAGGDFFEYTGASGVSLMSGAIAGTTMTLDPTSRLGAVTSPILVDKDWNIDDCGVALCSASNGNTAWDIITSETASNSKGTLTGTPLANAGDITGAAPAGLGMTADGRDDFTVTMLAGGFIGSGWGGFFGAQYFEVWNMTVYSLIKANADTDTTNAGVTKTVDLTGNDTTPFPPFTVDSVDAVSANGGTIVDNMNGTVEYTPPGAGFTGTDTFTYTISDADPGADPSAPVTYTDTATVTMTVNPSTAPNAVDDDEPTNQNTDVDIDVTSNDTTPVGTIDKTSVNIAAPAANGGTAVNLVTGVVTYTPDTDFVGDDTFSYTVKNTGGDLSNEATVTVTTSPAIVSSAGTFAPGTYAVTAGSTDGRVLEADVPPDEAMETQFVGGVGYDFEISGLAFPGQQINVFLPPLSNPIPAPDPDNPFVYRKFQTPDWVDFDLANVGTSTPNIFGACSSNIGDYTPGLNEGDSCITLLLEDGVLAGGDADGNPNSTIVDPGGIGLPAIIGGGGQSASRKKFDTDGSGCSISNTINAPAKGASWWLIAGFIAWLGWNRRRQLQH